VLLRPLLGLSGPAFTSVFQGLVRWNSFVFLPVVVAVFGERGLETAAVAIGALVPVINVLSVLVLARWGEGQGGGWRLAAKSLGRNPIILSCALGLTLNLLRVPTFGIDRALDLLGQGALPLGLIVAGAGLNFSVVAARPVTIAAVSVVKLLVLPILMWALCRAFGGDPLSQGVALACGSAPGRPPPTAWLARWAATPRSWPGSWPSPPSPASSPSPCCCWSSAWAEEPL
jgi:predicted permease